MATSTRYFIIPGLGNSAAEHWQTHLENSGSQFTRIQQREWDSPTCSEWVATVEKALEGQDLSNVVLIGHSLGCVTIAQWAAAYKHVVKGALLVAPSDVDTAQYAAFPTTGFTPMLMSPLPFKSIIVTSNNDPWVSEDRAQEFATAWGSEFLNIGPTGHINVASGHGKWPLATELLQRFE